MKVLEKYMSAIDIQDRELPASPRQIRFLERKGFQHVETWSFADAKCMIDYIADHGWRVPRGIVPGGVPAREKGGQRHD